MRFEKQREMNRIIIFRFIAVLFLVRLGIAASASELLYTQNIRGTVYDGDSRMTLVGVNVIVLGSDPLIGTTSDIDGKFILKDLPVGRYNLQLTYLGYEEKILPNILLGSGKEVVLEINMEESSEKLEEISVTATKNKAEAQNQMATVSARSFSVAETKRYAGSFNDPARMASAYAGVAAEPNGNNEIIIRGNSPMGLLWRLEGIEIPNPNHFAEEGATGGPISILNVNMLDNSDFYTGAFPAEFGNAYSGVFDLRMRKGNNQKREYSLMAGVLGVDCSAEGPLSKDKEASYLVNYRYSSLALLNAIGIKVVGDAVPKYQDAAFKFHFPNTFAGEISVWGIGGMSNVVEGDTSYHNNFATDMGAVGITNRIRLGNKAYINSTVATTISRNIWEYQEPNDNKEFWKLASENFVYNTGKANITLQSKISPRITTRTGINYSRLKFNLFSDWRDSTDRLITEVERDGATNYYQAFTNWKLKVSKELTLNAGVHATYLELNSDYAIEPRFGLRWNFMSKQSINAGVGVHSKVLPLTNYFAQQEQDGNTIQPNKNLAFPKAVHIVAGYETMLSPNLMAKVETYYQYLYDVAVTSDTSNVFSSLNYSSGYTDMALNNKGLGTNYGIDLTLEKFFSNNYFFTLTGSLYESKYTASNNKTYNTRYNGNYVLNILGGKEFALSKKDDARILAISTKGSFAGGHRFIPIDLEASREAGHTVRDFTNPYVNQRPSFIRVDLKMALRKNTAKTTRSLEMDIQNVTNTLNVAGDYYDPDTDSIETWTQLGLIPTLSYRIEF